MTTWNTEGHSKRRNWIIVSLMLMVVAIVVIAVTTVTFTRGDKNHKDDDAVLSNLLTGIVPSNSPSHTSTLYSSLPIVQIETSYHSYTPTMEHSQEITATDKPFHPLQSISPSPLDSSFVPTERETVTATTTPVEVSSCSRTLLSNSTWKNTVHCQDITVFYAIADVPYTLDDVLALPEQILSIPEHAEFLIHLGDIRNAVKENDCVPLDYSDVASTLKLSRVPVFLVMGDNEWNDCKNINQGWKLWHEEFQNFEDHWDHNFQVIRPSGRSENFAFLHKRTLFIGLNLVGGKVHNATEWTGRLTEQATWTMDLISNYTGSRTKSTTKKQHQRQQQEQVVPKATAVVIFGHANPSWTHDPFFVPLQSYLGNLAPVVPVLYLNGDAHIWNYNSSFFNVKSWMRIQLTGGVVEPPLQLLVVPPLSRLTTNILDVVSTDDVFLYDRRLN